MSAINAQEAVYLKHIFNQASVPANGTFELALFSTAPDDAGAGGTEIPSTYGYARVVFSNDTASWNLGTDATPSIKTNKIAHVFSCTGTNWANNVVGWGLYLNGGATLAHYQDLPVAVDMNVGDTLTFAVGALSVAVDLSTNFTSRKMADRVFGATSWTPPAALVFKAYSTTLTSAGDGTELSGNGYASVSLTSSGNWSVPTVGSITNTGAVTFAAATANWLPIQAIGLWSGSDLIWRCNLSSTIQVNSGNILKIAASGAVVTLD